MPLQAKLCVGRILHTLATALMQLPLMELVLVTRMPTIANAGMIGDPWSRCAICDHPYRISQLTRQRGILVCPEDLDDTDVEHRDSIIEAVLEGSGDEPRQPDILRGGVDVDDWDDIP